MGALFGNGGCPNEIFNLARVFHLQNMKSFVGNGQRQVSRAVELMKGLQPKFEKGMITPKPFLRSEEGTAAKSVFYRELERINVFDDSSLDAAIRAAHGKAMDNDIRIVDRSYEGEKRDGEHKSSTHPKRVAAAAIAIGDLELDTATGKRYASEAGLYHDCVEDLYLVTPQGLVLTEPESILDYLRKEKGEEFSGRIALLSRNSTNLPYLKYLAMVHWDEFCAFVKGCDIISNIMELDSADPRLVRNTVWKASKQVRRWQKISWPIAEILLHYIRKYEERMDQGGLAEYLRMISRRQLGNFERGYAVAGGRRFDPALLAQSALSGSPVATVYNSKNGIVELEFPFLEESAVRSLLEVTLERGNGDIKFVKSLLPAHLVHASIASLKADFEGIEHRLPEIVTTYDAFLNHMKIPGFVRKEWAEAAAEGDCSPEKLGQLQKKGMTFSFPLNIPFQENGGRRELSKLPALLKDHKPVPSDNLLKGSWIYHVCRKIGHALGLL